MKERFDGVLTRATKQVNRRLTQPMSTWAQAEDTYWYAMSRFKIPTIEAGFTANMLVTLEECSYALKSRWLRNRFRWPYNDYSITRLYKLMSNNRATSLLIQCLELFDTPKNG